VVIVAVVEGMVLVATPALVRDFSPQLGRASAMGFWTLGPVLGSFVATTVSAVSGLTRKGSGPMALAPFAQFTRRTASLVRSARVG
jgi:MFS family permease